MRRLQFLTAVSILFLLPTLWSCSIQNNSSSLSAAAPVPVAAPVSASAAAGPGDGWPSPPQEFPLLSQEVTDETLAAECTEEELTPPEPDQTLAQEVQDLENLGDWKEGQDQQPLKEEITYDFPVTMNKQVEYYLDFFQHKQPKTFRLWLERSGRYLPMITRELEEAGLPKDLVYLPMIESGYSLTAYSRAKAVGPWQFIGSTARHYGLQINSYIDERRDPVRSTQAAIQYITDLYEMFGTWPLAVAGYNAGEGKIQKGINRYKASSFWELAQHRFLSLETKRYVPKLIAAIMIAKSPEDYGFTDLQYQEPIAYDSVPVPRWTNLEAIATAADCDIDELKTLNRQLRKMVTPPEYDYYDIKVPTGKGELLSQNLPRVHVSVSTAFKSHTVRSNDTINGICKKYNLNKKTLLKANTLHKAKLTAGTRLRIPYQVVNYQLLTEEELANKNKYATSRDQFLLYTIKPGDSLSQIATLYGVTPQMVAAWNGLPSIHQIRAGQQLALYVSSIGSSDNSGITINETAKNSGKSPDTTSIANTETTRYKVRGGDSLWKIARKFNLRTADIKRWNNLKNNLIHPGLELLLKNKS